MRLADPDAGARGAPSLPPPSPDATTVARSNAAEYRVVRPGSTRPEAAMLVFAFLPLALAGAPLPELGAEAADTWLVLLGSKRDPAEPIPGLAVVEAHPELGARPARLLSSRFKNLMPCYTVTVAGALADKREAQELSGRLRAAGVDNYVKAAGAWVGPSAAIDAWCASDGEPSGAVTFLHEAGADVWAPVVGLPDDVAERLITGTPVAISESFDAWRQPVTGPPPGAPTTLYAVDVASGQAATCTVLEHAALTLGTPHFGVLQEGPLRAPACGSPRVYARVSCPGLASTGTWAVGTTPLVAYAPAGKGTARQLADAQAALAAIPEFVATPEGEPVERTVEVSLWKGPSGTVALVTGRVTQGGVCGGSDTLWFTTSAVAGNRLGAPVAPFQTAEFAEARGIVDADGDGRPEVALGSFPEDLRLVDPAGATTGELTVDFCDCPC